MDVDGVEAFGFHLKMLFFWSFSQETQALFVSDHHARTLVPSFRVTYALVESVSSRSQLGGSAALCSGVSGSLSASTGQRRPQLVDANGRDPSDESAMEMADVLKIDTDFERDQMIVIVEVVTDDRVCGVTLEEPDILTEGTWYTGHVTSIDSTLR